MDRHVALVSGMRLPQDRPLLAVGNDRHAPQRRNLKPDSPDGCVTGVCLELIQDGIYRSEEIRAVGISFEASEGGVRFRIEPQLTHADTLSLLTL